MKNNENMKLARTEVENWESAEQKRLTIMRTEDKKKNAKNTKKSRIRSAKKKELSEYLNKIY